MGSWDRKLLESYVKGLFHPFLFNMESEDSLAQIIWGTNNAELCSHIVIGISMYVVLSSRPLFCSSLKWMPELITLSTMLIRSGYCLGGCFQPQHWKPYRHNVAYIAYLCTCGWHSILWPVWDIARRTTSSHICHDLILSFSFKRHWIKASTTQGHGCGLVIETLKVWFCWLIVKMEKRTCMKSPFFKWFV